MIDNMTSKRVSLMERIRQITSGGLLICGTARANTTAVRPSSVVNRAVAVQDAMKEKLRTDAGANSAKELPRAQTLSAEWINWTNWNNWVNY